MLCDSGLGYSEPVVLLSWRKQTRSVGRAGAEEPALRLLAQRWDVPMSERGPAGQGSAPEHPPS